MKEQRISIPFWYSKADTGNYISVSIRVEHIELLKSSEGKKLLFKVLKPESVKKDTSPVAYIEILD